MDNKDSWDASEDPPRDQIYINQETDDLYVSYTSGDLGGNIDAIWYEGGFKKLTWWRKIKIWIQRTLGIDCWDIYFEEEKDE